MLAVKTALWLLFTILTVFTDLPYLILSLSGGSFFYNIGLLRWSGIIPVLLGLSLLGYMGYLLTHFGRGTPAPFAPTKKLVIEGPYRVVRNPGYIAAMIILIGESVLMQSWALTIYTLVMAPIFHIYVVFVEEPGLRKRFGADYMEYCRKVPRWIPKGKSSETG